MQFMQAHIRPARYRKTLFWVDVRLNKIKVADEVHAVDEADNITYPMNVQARASVMSLAHQARRGSRETMDAIGAIDDSVNEGHITEVNYLKG